jgi:hypothetical protein
MMRRVFGTKLTRCTVSFQKGVGRGQGAIQGRLQDWCDATCVWNKTHEVHCILSERKLIVSLWLWFVARHLK